MKKQYVVAIVFVFMCFIVGIAISRGDKASAGNVHTMCQTVQSIVSESNNRIPAHEADTEGLVDFLKGARDARQAAYERGGAQEDREAAQTYSEIIQYVNANVYFDKLPPPDCDKLFD